MVTVEGRHERDHLSPSFLQKNGTERQITLIFLHVVYTVYTLWPNIGRRFSVFTIHVSVQKMNLRIYAFIYVLFKKNF